jgi:hypothetical protein
MQYLACARKKISVTYPIPGDITGIGSDKPGFPVTCKELKEIQKQLFIYEGISPWTCRFNVKGISGILDEVRDRQL